MVKFFLFAVSRYSLFLSYVAVFLAGLSLWISLPFGIVCLALSLLLGSLSAFLRRRVDPPAVSVPSPDILFSNILSQISKDT
jgi:hypothetical protein